MITPNELRLLTSARERDLAGLQKALQQGVNVNASNDEGWTALLLCARGGFVEGVEVLLQMGADVNARKRDGFNALHLVIERAEGLRPPFGVVAPAARSRPSPADAIRRGLNHDATEYLDCVRLVKLLLSHAIEPDVHTVLARQTPLSHAAFRGTVELLDLLLATGRVQVNGQDKDGVTPLHYAARNGRVECVRSLLRAGADVRAQELFGFTPLHEAAENGQDAVARVLLRAGADLHAGLTRAFEGYPVGATSHDVALARGHLQLLDLLSGRVRVAADVTVGAASAKQTVRAKTSVKKTVVKKTAAKKSSTKSKTVTAKKSATNKSAVKSKKPTVKKPAAKKAAVKTSSRKKSG